MSTQKPAPEEQAYYELAYDGWIPFDKHPASRDDDVIRLWLCRANDFAGRMKFRVRLGSRPAEPVVAYQTGTMTHYKRYGMECTHSVEDLELHTIAARILADQVTMAGDPKRR